MMTPEIKTGNDRPRFQGGLFGIALFVVAGLVILPIASVVVLAFSPSESVWRHLISTSLPRYLENTLFLMILVGAISAIVGTVPAWLVTLYRFPLSRFLELALFMPLAIPAYVSAYALVDFLEFAGPVQSGLRSMFDWNRPADYFFPEIRSRGGAVVVLSAALYPYVYLLTRAAFREQSQTVFDVSRTLGARPFRKFVRVGLPLVRPSLATGVAIAMMETVSDFGVVEYFAVQTLTTGIYTVWLQGYNIGGAAQISVVILGLILILVALERTTRRTSGHYSSSAQAVPIFPTQLRGAKGIFAAAICFLPFAVGFLLPVVVISYHALRSRSGWLDAELVDAFLNTLLTGGTAAVVTVGAAVFLVYGAKLRRGWMSRNLLTLTTLGYAAPGAVLGLGVLIPMAAADHFIADVFSPLFDRDLGLLMTGSAFAIIFAYSVRFFAIAQGATDAAMGGIAPSIPIAARSLGQTAAGTLTSVYLPLIRGSLFSALLLVFVDCVKELPATLLLRPFNFNTLATSVYDHASLEDISSAAPAALLIALVGILGVVLLAKANR